MTNSQIITEAEIALAQAGVIAPGEPIHTYQHWKSMGYQVKKGQRGVAKIMIWKIRGVNKDGEVEKIEIDETDNRYFKKLAAFFSLSQVEKI